MRVALSLWLMCYTHDCHLNFLIAVFWDTKLLAAYVSFLQDNKISPPLMLTLLQMMSHCPNLFLLCLLSEPDSSFKASVTTTGESVISIATSKSQAAIISTPEVIEFISPSAADNAVNQFAIATSTKSVSTMISPPISHHDTCNESNMFEPVTSANVEDLISLATVTNLRTCMFLLLLFVLMKLLCLRVWSPLDPCQSLILR